MSLRRGFEAVDRGDRGVGVRDTVLVLPSVICSREVADRIADRVPGAVSAPHDHGCGQIGADKAQTHRTFLGVGANPNVAGTVVVGLGCESIQSDDVAADLADLGVPVRETAIQDAGGTDATVEAGVEAVEELRDRSTGDGGTTTADLSDLTVGVVSGDLAESTRETADPLVGAVVDELVDAGARVVAAGSERAVAHPEAAVERAASDGAAAALRDLAARHRDQPARASRVGREAREREFEAVTRAWGEAPVRAALDYGERATHEEGLAVVDAPSRFAEAATGLVAAGAQVVVHVTGEGVATGHPVAPVVKVSGDPETLAAVGDDIDVDATAAEPEDLLARLRAVAGGERVRAEDHGLVSSAITRVGPSM
ncbi:UxaA family hydrolase [Halosimplex pelagicum]|uniref:UxaA family hydrolase n=1 Tax=Halosimplex pelagicum TaxID=869886 RepID=A0A7D5P9R7_9EURY|nr:UxaA family hydrolase [Halosimplex pelagicum]QLH84263.1 UxaA family hydrolase [Halosimplex pelagicum]